MISKNRTATLMTVAWILTLGAPLFGQRGGRGVPALPSVSRVPEGRFPGFPPNAGVGQPETPGRPATATGGSANRPADTAAPDSALQAATATEQLARTPRLAGRLAEMLGVDQLTTEPDGFRNLGLFVAAVEVSSHVEGTTFDGLKARLLGDDTTDPVSLGQAIQDETGMSEAEAAETAGEAAEQAAETIEETS